MPTVSVLRNLLFSAIGKPFSDDEFSTLCFEFGIELDDITSDAEIARREKGDEAAAGLSEEVMYKIEVPANRYDILCLEGLARALRIFLQMEKIPEYNLVLPPKPQVMIQTPETLGVRGFVVCAVLRGLQFDSHRYASFIDLQDKLHQNIGRRRTLVAIGTHDLDTLQGPFTYTAKPKKDIRFRALGQRKEMDVEELFSLYRDPKENSHLKPYLHITEDAPLHPVIVDSKGVVLSLPPIINGEHSKITLRTTNVFIECTGTDFTKLNIALNTIVAMFSECCTSPFTIEQVEVVNALSGGRTHKSVTPTMEDHVFTVHPDYINKGLGLSLRGADMARVLSRMQLATTVCPTTDLLTVRAPATRTDILHACDIQEDVAIAFGYNNLAKTLPKCATVGKEQPLNKLSDQIREQVALAGFVEVMTWVLVNEQENFASLNHLDNGLTAVTLANPKTEEFNVVRTTLLPGLLKTLESNKGRVNLPIQIFECSDVVVQDPSRDVGARNVRMLSALYSGNNSGLEQVHGLVDRIMEMNDITFLHDVETLEEDDRRRTRPTYRFEDSENPTFFAGRRADVYVEERKVGSFGIFHPAVLAKFGILHPTSALELCLEAFL